MHDDIHYQQTPPPPPIPPSRSTPYLPRHHPQRSFASSSFSTSSLQLPSPSVPSFTSGHSAYYSSAAEDGAMAERQRPWRRGTSSRQPQVQTPRSQRDNNDGYLPYRPPFASTSAASLSPPVRPSGAQGIGLAPAPVPTAAVQPPQKTSFFSNWFGGRRKWKQRQKLSSVSTPALVQSAPHASASRHPHYYHQRQGPSSDNQPYNQHHGHHSQSHLGNNLPPPSHYQQYNDDPRTVKESPSVLTGLLAPKLLFSPLSRNLRSDNHPSDPFYAPGPSHHPYGLSTPNLQRSGHEIEVVHVLPPTRPYPRIGDNSSYQSLPGSKNRWAGSNVTLHSEGSKSRLAVSTMCDALTFPRPRMNAHDITPPDSPDAMESEVDEPAAGDGDTDFTRALSEREAREAERDEWAEFARSRRSNSIGQRSAEWSAHGTPVRPSSSRHTLTAGERPPPNRSRSTSSSIRSLFRSGTQRFGRVSQSHEDLPQTLTHLDSTPRATRPARSSSSSLQSHQSLWNDSYRGAPPTPQRSNSRKSLGGVFRRNNSLPKSTSTPTLAAGEDRHTPRRAKSVRTPAGSRSNPDLSGHPAAPGSPAIKRRPTGPPRTFQFRLQPASSRPGAAQPSSAGVMVVGSSSGDARLPKLPRTIDFAEPSKLRPPGPPSPPPHLPTPERSSPFNYAFDDDTIGVAITTDNSEMAGPVQPVAQKLPMDTPPSARPTGVKEDPSSAHARYVLARQHRREQTMRAFQSPPMSPSSRLEKSPSVYPKPLPGQDRPSTYSRASIYSQASGYSQPSSISAAFSPAAYPRPEYPTPQRQATFGKRDSRRGSTTPPPPVPKLAKSPPMSPRSPKSPTTSWFGRPRPIRSPSPSEGRRAGSRSKPNTPMRQRIVPAAAPATVAAAAAAVAASQATAPTPAEQQRQAAPESPTPARREKALPLIPSTTPSRIPPQRAPPTFPPPPTPSLPPSRSASSVALDEAGAVSRTSSYRGHSRRPSDSSHFDSATSLPLSFQSHHSGPISTPGVPRLPTESPTPVRKDSFGAVVGAGPTAPAAPLAPSKNPRQTPPPGANLPTIMDESPTPIRQTRVSVLAAERSSPATPVPGSQSSVAGRQLASSTSSLSSVTGRSLMGSMSGTPTLASQRPGPPSTLFPAQPMSPDATSPAQTAAHPMSANRARGHRSILSAGSIFGVTPEPASSASTPPVTGSVGRRTPEVTTLRHMPSATALLNIAAGPEQEETVSSSSVSLYSEETSNDEWQTPTAYPAELNPTSDSDSELSEATLPDLFGGPVSSTSALSHYSDALASPADWVVHEEEEPTWPTSATPLRELAIPEDSAVTPPQMRMSPALVAEGPATPPSQVRRLSNDNRQTLTTSHMSPSRRQTITSASQGDLIESLTLTPRPSHRSPGIRQPESDDDDETFEFDRVSMSSGSESSVRQSLDENFRGLFFRTPQVPVATGQPDRRRSAQLVQSSLRESPVPGEYGGPLQSSPRALHASPHDFGSAASEGTFELRTPLLGGSNSGSVSGIPFPRGPSDSAPSTLAPPSPAIPQGLGMSLMSPNSPGATFPPLFESRLGSSTPPVSPMPRDDSWISESYRQAAAALRAGSGGSVSSTPAASGSVGSGATPGRLRSKNKHRTFSAENALSPSTFGVSSASTLPDPLQVPQTQQTITPQRPLPHSSSSSSSLGLVTPNPDQAVVEQFPSPPV